MIIEASDSTTTTAPLHETAAPPGAPPCASSSSDASSSASTIASELEQLAQDLDDAAARELDPHEGICEAWASWVRTRRFYKPPSLPPSILGRLTSRSRSFSGGPDTYNDAELHALNAAIEAEPMEALDRQVFELHYRHRVKGIKTFAQALGIGRQHWYTLLRSFEERVVVASIEIRARNERDRRALRSFSD